MIIQNIKVIYSHIGFIIKFKIYFIMDSVMQQPIVENGNILNLMKQSKIYWQAKKQIMNSILKNKSSSLWQPSIQEIIKTIIVTDNQEKIKGLITNCLQKSTRRLPIEKDTNPEIQAYRAKWSDLICKEFNNISGKIFRQEEYDQQDQSVSYTYDSSTLLEFMASIKIKSSIGVRDSHIFLFPNDVLKVSKYPQIRNKYNFLQAQQNVLGGYQDDLKDRQKKAKKIADGQNISSQIQNYLCYGCVNGERINVYKKYFQCFYQYNGKRVDYSLYEKVWKPIIKFDCREILKEPTYFVFKQEMQKIFKLFICDKQVSQMVKIRQLTPDPQLDKFAPIHHIIPCKSFSTYLAPFCYSSLSAQEIYQMFRQVYCTYLIHLNTISSLPDSILSLGILFEQLLFTTQKKLVTKFQSLGIQPLRLVFPWIFYSFVGYIDIEQFYLILDRIIGSKSLQILPLYAISIMFKYKTQILQAKSQSEIIQILQDGLKQDIFVDTIRQFFKYHL